jgi:glycerophosphoryl diester phosphodiesterase
VAAAAAFDLQAHRGGRGLAPESTLAAFRNAAALGVTTIETDLAVTKDDVLVLSHEPRLNPDLVRGPDGKWIAPPGPTIRSLTLAELKRYDIGRLNPSTDYGRQFPTQKPSDGERFPTLAELYAMAGPGPLQHRDQGRSDQARRNRPAGGLARLVVDEVRAANGTAHDHPVIRLAHPDRGAPHRA